MKLGASCHTEVFQSWVNMTLEHKTSHKSQYYEIEFYASSKSWINNTSIGVWFGQYLKIWNLRMQKHLNIEKIIFKVVQIKLLAMHINNKKLCFVSSDRESDELYLSHTIIQSIMCSLHLTHPSAHTPGAVGGSVPCSRVSPQSWTLPARAGIRTHNLGLQVQRSIH